MKTHSKAIFAILEIELESDEYIEADQALKIVQAAEINVITDKPDIGVRSVRKVKIGTRYNNWAYESPVVRVGTVKQPTQEKKYWRYWFEVMCKEGEWEPQKKTDLPYYLTGEGIAPKGKPFPHRVVAWLPAGVDIKEHWPNAFDIQYKEYDSIEHSDRFPDPGRE